MDETEREKDDDPFGSVFFSETLDNFPFCYNFFPSPLEIDVLEEDEDKIPLLNMFEDFERDFIPSNKGQILETSFRRDSSSSSAKYHPLRPAVFAGIKNTERVIICRACGTSLNVVFTDLSSGLATFQDKCRTPATKRGVVTDMVPLVQSTKNKGTILISENNRLGIMRLKWELNGSAMFSNEYDTTVLEVVPSSKSPIVSSGQIREIDVNKKGDRAVIAGHSDQVQTVDIHKWQCVTKTKSFGVVGSVRWKDLDSNILTWTTDQGCVSSVTHKHAHKHTLTHRHLVLYDQRISSAMCSRYPFAPWSSGSLPYVPFELGEVREFYSHIITHSFIYRKRTRV